ncbi:MULTISPECIES: GntR family transcriptional regulator [Thermomonosporaceae]|uniref:GntR family transcriptional regulator n=1 Tax=Thermomonosporaceae TaxID=2012 RepID=UPI00255A9B39|nr:MULTISPECIES: GntR family transcriptional regulator [Thermomonosporaceae]MDL4771218.1 GntR family transcriptional regulator [Actinomadura xylanilytica]
MLLRLAPGDPRPLHEQAASAIRRAITAGEVAPDERIPPARDLAQALGINPNTALRALRQLREEGLLEFRRGRGIRVAARPEDGHLVERARELVAEAERLGVSRAQLITLIEGV